MHPSREDVVEAELGDLWLGKAVHHLLVACDVTEPAVEELIAGVTPSFVAAMSVSADAFLQRLDESRLSILFTAMAAESYVNRYIHTHAAPDQSVLGDLAPVDRFNVAPRLAGRDVFPRGFLAFGRLEELFRLKDELVRSRYRPGAASDLAAQLFDRFNPASAQLMLTAGAQAAIALGELDHRYLAVPSRALNVAQALAARAEAASTIPVPTADELEAAARRNEVRFPEDMIGA